MTDATEQTDPFLDMSKRIEATKTEEFGGAFVVVTPGGQRFEALVVGNNPDPMAFWSMLKLRIEIAYAQVQSEEAAKNNGPFGRR